MSPNDPEPILRTMRYLQPTMKSPLSNFDIMHVSERRVARARADSSVCPKRRVLAIYPKAVEFVRGFLSLTNVTKFSVRFAALRK